MSDATNQTKTWYERYPERYLQGRNPYFLDEQLKTFAGYFNDEHPSNGKILDIGAAGGLRYPALKQFLPDCNYESCDIAQSFVAIARATYPYLQHYESNVADWETMPRGPYHGILCLSVLQHVAENEIQYAASNMFQLLVPRGLALVSLPTSHIAGYKDDTRHFTILSNTEQRKLLELAGFKIRVRDQTKGFKSADVWNLYLVQKPN